MTIDTLIADIIHREGGYSDRAADRGGPTNMGITMPTLASWLKRPVTKQEIQQLSKQVATDIYRSRYVSPWKFVSDPLLRTLLIDWSVTSGPDDPARALQMYLDTTGALLTTDGQLGPATREAWKAYESSVPNSIARRFVAKARIEFYITLALDREARAFMQSHPSTQLHNLRGWVRRALEFL